jgi:fructosamine-3-kinase
MDIRQAIAVAVSPPSPVTDVVPLGGGCIGQVYRVQLADGRQLVAKVDDSHAPCLDIEGDMLRYLAGHSQLPVPAVWYSSPQLLLMDYLPGDSHFSVGAQRHAAHLLAALHGVTAPHYGLAQDTLIGGLSQPNPPTASWLEFFREHRLCYMGQEAWRNGRLPAAVWQRVQRFADDVGRWLHEPEQPALLHGDVWTTNVLAQGDKITGFIDPAIYYGHPEIELAFTTLFGTFGQPFFEEYQRLRPLGSGFFEERRDIYNLYPLLVHVRLFGGGYVGSVERILSRFGY